MQCKNCGANLVRGFSFCLDCGMPVPPEALEESGLPMRNIDSGPQEPTETPNITESAPARPETTGDVKPQMQGIAEESSGTDLKPKYLGGETGVGGKELKPKLIGVGEETGGSALKAKPIGGTERSGGGEDIHAAMQGSSADADDNKSEKLVFCPNCGMRMQHNGSKCEKCGMKLTNKPDEAKSEDAKPRGIPLFNNESDSFSGFGGFGGASGELAGLSDADADRIDSFISGGLNPMFNSGNSMLDIQATPDDFARLNEQLASFSSAAGMMSLEPQQTIVRQKEPEAGKEREVVNFSMNDDDDFIEPTQLSSIAVVGDYSMEEKPDEDIDLDPYKFLNNSMDEYETNVREQYGIDFSDTASGQSSGIPSISAAPAAEPVAAPATEPAPESAPEPKSASESAPESKSASESAPEPKSAPESASEPKSAPESAPESKSAPESAPEPKSAPESASEPKTAPESAPEPKTAPESASEPAPLPKPATKRCYACGRNMPMSENFCPNCGRPMSGGTNPHIPSPPAPQKKKSILPFILIAVAVVIAAVIVFFALRGNASAVGIEAPDSTAAVLTQADINCAFGDIML